MKLYLSTGGERCVNPFENLNSFMPLALPSWTYPRLRFSSILASGGSAKGESSERRVSLSNPWYERVLRVPPFPPPEYFDSRTKHYLFPRTAYASFSSHPRAHALTFAALISARAESSALPAVLHVRIIFYVTITTFLFHLCLSSSSRVKTLPADKFNNNAIERGEIDLSISFSIVIVRG